MANNDPVNISRCIPPEWGLLTPERGSISDVLVLEAIASATLMRGNVSKQSLRRWVSVVFDRT